uniref:Uncharacterized protein n=1 Tax=Ascaris lumbricoides TaxID=6252 RepID=A0A0M3HS69_ASCLU
MKEDHMNKWAVGTGWERAISKWISAPIYEKREKRAATTTDRCTDSELSCYKTSNTREGARRTAPPATRCVSVGRKVGGVGANSPREQPLACPTRPHCLFYTLFSPSRDCLLRPKR